MSWSEKQIEAVWQKGRTVEGYAPEKYRLDVCGAWMERSEFGSKTILGWEIDHVFPQSQARERGYSQEEIDAFENLRPMNWNNNNRKGNDYPDYISAVTSEGNKNVFKEGSWKVAEYLRVNLSNRFKIKRKVG